MCSLSRLPSICSPGKVSPPPLISLLCPCFFPLAPSLNSSVIYSKSLRVGYSESCCVCDLSFLHTHLLWSSLHWVNDCMCMRSCREYMYVCLFSLYCIISPHLFGCRCLGTRRPQHRMSVSWTSWVTPSLKSTTKSLRYVLYCYWWPNMHMCSHRKAKTNDSVKTLWMLLSLCKKKRKEKLDKLQSTFLQRLDSQINNTY